MRTVQPETASSGVLTFRAGPVTAPETGSDSKAADNYIDRVRAYVPVEVIAFFIFVNSLPTLPKQPDTWGVQSIQEAVALGALVLGAVATIFYTKVAARTNGVTVWRVQGALSLIAFLVWTYAMGGKGYAVLNIIVEPALAAALLATFTLFSGLVVPVTPGATPNPNPNPDPDPLPVQDQNTGREG